MDLDNALKQWAEVIGPESVLCGDNAQAVYGNDTTGARRHIVAGLQITQVESLPKVMEIAARYKVGMYPISTGKNWGYGSALPAKDGCAILDLSRLNKILHFDPHFGVVTVQPGVTQGDLSRFLEDGGHPYMVPVTGAGPSCSLLGNALERGYGVTPHTDHFGAVTDLEAVLADGSIYKTAMREAGGEELARLFKYGIGPYSSGLFTQGNIGVVTRMSIVLARRPESVKVCFFGLKDDHLLEAAVVNIQRLLARLPGIVGGINLMNRHRVLAMATTRPSDNPGQNGLLSEEVLEKLGREHQVMPWTGFCTLYGTKDIVSAAQAEIKKALSGVASRLVFFTPERSKFLASAASRLPGAMGKRLKSTLSTVNSALELVNGYPNETALPLAYWRNQVSARSTNRNPSRDCCGLIWYAPLVPMRATDVRAFTSMVTRVTAKHGIDPLITLTSVSDRLFDSTVPITFDQTQSSASIQAKNCYDALLNEGAQLGFFPYRLPIHIMDDVSMRHPHASAFHAKLRSALDPHGTISPGRYE